MAAYEPTALKRQETPITVIFGQESINVLLSKLRRPTMDRCSVSADDYIRRRLGKKIALDFQQV